MKKLNVKLENCYWIKSLDTDFDFTESNVYSIYAPNGTMKTSFLKWFQDYISPESRKPSDRINDIEWEILLTDEDDNIINKKNIFPIESLNLDYHWNFSDLLINPDFQKEYKEVYWKIEKQKNKLLKWVCSLAKVPQASLEDKILTDFWQEWLSFFDFLNLETWWINFKQLNDYKSVKYGIIFNPKVNELLEDPELAWNIWEYDKKYKEIIKKYSCFKLWGFTIYQAENLSKEFWKTNYFTWTSNEINLSAKWYWNIKSEEEFNNFIKEIKDEISTNDDLVRLLNLISNWAKDVKDFQIHIDSYWEKFISKLNHQTELKKDLWNFYFNEKNEDYQELKNIYNWWIKRLSEILDDAKNHKSEWFDTIKIFKDRFDIDFDIDLEDKQNTIVWREEAKLKFTYNKNNELKECSFNKQDLLKLKILSNWEKRVMYLLYIIFEIQRRKNEWWKHLLIIDDIADSFDYKNKYAIIEYLDEIRNIKDRSWNKIFNLIILTHNFDFYRNIQLRLHGKNSIEKCLLATKLWDEIELDNIEKMWIIDPFTDWKNRFHKKENYAKLIWLIPFIRNILEYSWEKIVWWLKKKYNTLTSLLHIKPDTKNIRIRDFELIIQSVILDKKDKSLNEHLNTEEDLMYDFILKYADEIYRKPSLLKLEEKILLSIYIRLRAEEIMLNILFNIENLKYKDEPITWEDFWNKITSNQTRVLFDIISTYKWFKIHNLWEDNELNEEKIIKQVLLMTPENIHLNSFMYEPILDMSDLHLRKLYKKINILINK